MKDRTLLDLIDDGLISTLTPTLKYSIWCLIQRGKSRAHLRMMIRSKTGNNQNLRDASFAYIDRCVDALAAGTGYPV